MHKLPFLRQQLPYILCVRVGRQPQVFALQRVIQSCSKHYYTLSCIGLLKLLLHSPALERRERGDRYILRMFFFSFFSHRTFPDFEKPTSRSTHIIIIIIIIIIITIIIALLLNHTTQCQCLILKWCYNNSIIKTQPITEIFSCRNGYLIRKASDDLCR